MKKNTIWNYHLIKPFSYFLLSAVLAFTNVDKIHAQDNKGTEFWFSPPSERYTNYVVQLYFTGYYDATIVIDYVARPGQTCATHTLTLTGGTFQTAQLPFTPLTCPVRYVDALETPETVNTNGIRITSTAPIAVYYIHYEPASTEMVPILPVTKMGMTYITTAYREITSATNDFNSRVTITAIENGTNINIQLPSSTWTSTYPGTPPGMLRSPGSTWSITLNKGETYTFICNDNGLAPGDPAPAPATGTIKDNRGLNGVRITANKKISVISGTDCTWIGNIQYSGCGACDLTATHLLPVEQWSTTHITTQTLIRANNVLPLGNNASSSISDYLWFTTDQNATTVNITGAATAVVNLPNANDFQIYESPGQGLVPANPGATHHVIRSNNPISVMQMMKGWQCDNNGGADPSQMLVFPENTFAKDYIITNPNQYANNFIVFLVKNTGGPGNTSLSSMSLMVNGAAVPIPPAWTQIGTEPYYYNRVNIAGGAVIQVRGDSLFAFYASGSGGPGSYGYMGGASCGLKAYAHADTTNICSGNAAVTLELDSTKFGGPVLGSVSYTYTWTIQSGTTIVCSNVGSGTNPTSTCSITSPGVYTGILHLTDNAGCSAIDTFPIVVTNDLPAPSVSNNSPVCEGGSVTLSSSSTVAGVSYNWTGPGGYAATGQNQTLSNVTTAMAGTYYVTTTLNGCTGIDSTVVVIDALPIISIAGTSTICTGGSSLLTASGGSAYSWSTGETTTSITVAPVSSSVYSVTATNGVCPTPSTASFTVTISTSITAFISGNTSICSGNPTTLTASGGSTYSWSTTETTNSIVVSPTGTTSYSVTALSGTCVDDTSITVTVNPSPAVSVSGSNIICSGASATLTASGGANYVWSNGATSTVITVTPTANTTYSVTASGTNGCTSTASFSVAVTPVLVAVISGNTTICQGETTTLTASGGSTYSWNTTETTNSITVSPAGTTSYSVSTFSGTCSADTSVTVVVTPVPTVSISGNTQFCRGDTTTLTASGGANYSWSNGPAFPSITVLPTISTTYSVTAYDVNGCTATAAVSVTVFSPPVVAISGNTSICNGQIATLTASGGGNYFWSPGGQTSASITTSTLGTYSVLVSDANNCTTVEAVTIAPSAPIVANTVATNANCGQPDGTASVTASGGTSPYSYLWSNIQAGSSATGLSAGTYSVLITDANGCTQTDTISVGTAPGPTANAGPDVTIAMGESANLSASGGIIYSWNPSTGLSCSNCADPVASPAQTTEYCVTVTDANGCSDSTCVKVTLEAPCPDNAEIDLPTAFTPNGDGHNDLFLIAGLQNCIERYSLIIFDRWGEKVFETTDLLAAWNGKYHNRDLDAGVFVYYFSAVFTNGQALTKKGNISLIR